VMTVHNYRLVCLNAQLLREGRPCELCVGTHPWRGVAYSCYRSSMPASAVAAGTIVVNRWLRTWDRQVDLFLVLTGFMRNIIERSGISGDRIALVPNFVADPGPRRSRPADSDVVLFVGRLAREKGIHLLIEAWHRVRPASLQLVVVGEGPLRAELEGRCVPGVHFRGHLDRERLRDLMLNSRALAFPSIWYEGQSMVVLEALAAGLPVLANDLGGIGETIGQGGRLVQNWDEALREVLLDSGLIDALSVTARGRWSDRFSPVGHLSAMLAAYAKATYLQNDVS
jgi:glycosyltransferase involved in cell wall biosynthesis